MASSEADEEVEDTGALAAVGCLRAISTILESISSLPHLFPQIELTLLPILRRMLTSDGQGIKLFTHNYGSTVKKTKGSIFQIWIHMIR